MGFDLSIPEQSTWADNTFKMEMYSYLHEMAIKKVWWIRLSGLPVGIISGILTVATRIALIAESILKGFCDIVGSLFCLEQCSFGRGLFQICWVLPVNVLVLPVSIFSAALGLIFKPIKMASIPVNYTLRLWHWHDPEEKLKYEAKQEKIKLENSIKTLEERPNDIALIKFVANCYQKGIGTKPNNDEAILYTKRAAELGDISSMVSMGDHYDGVKNYKEAFGWYEKAEKLQDPAAMYAVAHYYENGLHGDKDTKKAFELYLAAEIKENVNAQFRLGLSNCQNSKDYKTAADYFRKAADKGHSPSATYLYTLINRKPVLQKDPMEWYRLLPKVDKNLLKEAQAALKENT